MIVTIIGTNAIVNGSQAPKFFYDDMASYADTVVYNETTGRGTDEPNVSVFAIHCKDADLDRILTALTANPDTEVLSYE